MNVSLVVNPIAGNKAHKFIDSLTALLEKRSSLTTCITRKKGDAYEFARNLTRSDRIIVASGDGTLNEVFNGLRSADNPSLSNLPVAIIPVGTTNVLAKDRGLPESLEEAVDTALEGTPRTIALGRINGTYFSLMAGIGIDGSAVKGVKNNFIKKVSGKGAHVVAGFQALKDYDPPLITIRTPEQELSGYTAVIGNARNYGGYFFVTPDADITEPMLDVCVFKGKGRIDLLIFVSGVIRQKHLAYDDVVYLKTSELEISAQGPVDIQIDGDYFGTLPVKIDVISDGARLVW